MIKDIINKYGEFSDSWITEIKYYKKMINTEDINVIELIINCANKQNDYIYEVVNLTFKNIVSFNFSEINKSDNFASSDVLIKTERELITFDFFPIDYFDYLEENPNSNFIIKCKEVSYKVLSNKY